MLVPLFSSCFCFVVTPVPPKNVVKSVQNNPYYSIDIISFLKLSICVQFFDPASSPRRHLLISQISQLQRLPRQTLQQLRSGGATSSQTRQGLGQAGGVQRTLPGSPEVAGALGTSSLLSAKWKMCRVRMIYN